MPAFTGSCFLTSDASQDPDFSSGVFLPLNIKENVLHALSYYSVVEMHSEPRVKVRQVAGSK